MAVYSSSNKRLTPQLQQLRSAAVRLHILRLDCWHADVFTDEDEALLSQCIITDTLTVLFSDPSRRLQRLPAVPFVKYELLTYSD